MMRQNFKLALGLAVSAATILSVSAGPESDQEAEGIPVTIVLETSGLKGAVELEVGVYPFLKDETTGEKKVQFTRHQRYALGPLGPNEARQGLSYTLKPEVQYQFTADIVTESGTPPDFTYTLPEGIDTFQKVDLTAGAPVVLTLKKTPRREKIGTFFDVSKINGVWSMAYYGGQDEVSAVTSQPPTVATDAKKKK